MCVCCAPCVCSVNRPVPSLLSCLGGFVSCHAHVTRPSSRAEPSQVTKWPSVQVAIHFLCFCFCFSFFALSLLRCLIKFQFQAGGQGPGGRAAAEASVVSYQSLVMSWATDLTQLAAHLRCTCAPEAEAACLLHERERHREFD